MKRVSLFLMFTLLAGGVFADPFYIEGKILPAVSNSEVTIAAAGANLRNCLTNATVISNSTYTFRILDGGATTYQLLMGAGSGLAQDWHNPSNPFCGSPNTIMKLKVDNGSYTINYEGVVGKP